MGVNAIVAMVNEADRRSATPLMGDPNIEAKLSDLKLKFVTVGERALALLNEELPTTFGRAEEAQLQILSMISFGLTKETSKKKVKYLNLTKSGYLTGHRIIAASGRRYFHEGPYRSSNRDIRVLKDVKDAYSRLCLQVDLREFGSVGVKKSTLHVQLNELERAGIPFICSPLKVGDYLFFDVDERGGKVVPLFVERKSIVDVAKSIKDKRWENQKKNVSGARSGARRGAGTLDLTPFPLHFAHRRCGPLRLYWDSTRRALSTLSRGSPTRDRLLQMASLETTATA